MAFRTPKNDDERAPWPHPACVSDSALLEACEIGFGKSGGPGGQHRNKVQSLVRLVHLATGIETHAGERRSQAENRAVALRRMRLALAVEVRATVPAGEIGSALWRSRRRTPPEASAGGHSPLGPWKGGGTGIIEVSPDHHDYPALLAEALDVIAAAAWEPRAASLRLNCSATQLIRFVAEHPPALVRLNAERARLGLGTLRG